MEDDNTWPSRIDGEGDKRPHLIASQTVTIVFAVLAVALRFVCRRLSRTGLGFDDWLIIPALSCALAYYALSWWMISWGLGFYVGEVILTKVRNILLGTWINQILYTASITLATFSILAYLWKTFPNKGAKVLGAFLGLLRLGWLAATIAFICLECRPIQAIWDPSYSRDCPVDRKMLFLGSGASDIGLDAATIALAAALSIQPRLSGLNGLLLVGAFTLGCLIPVFSGLRLKALLSLDMSMNEELNSSWSTVETSIWTGVEMNVAIVAACVPCLRTLFFKDDASTLPAITREKTVQSPGSEVLNPRPSQPRTRTSGPGIGGVPGAWYRISRMSQFGMLEDVEFRDAKHPQSTRASRRGVSEVDLPIQNLQGDEMSKTPQATQATQMNRPPSWAAALPLWDTKGCSGRAEANDSVARPISHLPDGEVSTIRSSIDVESGRGSPWPLKG